MAGFIPSVLFVCLGNICRSPTAEAVFRHKAKERGLDIKIDSAGTHGYHDGREPDLRSQKAGVARGYSFKGLYCRKVMPQDFSNFDYIFGMDLENVANLKRMSQPIYHPKLRLFLDFSSRPEREVPDPYYGSAQGFELALDLIENAADGLLKHITGE